MKNSSRQASLGVSLFQLGFEAQTVMTLRMMKFALGGSDAAAEAQRMFTEKIDAAIVANGHLAAGLMSGSISSAQQKAVTHYRRKVRANRRRLKR